MGYKKKGKYSVKIRPPTQYQPVYARKKGISKGVKVLIGLSLIAIIAISLHFTLGTQPAQSGQPTASPTQSYPQNVAPVFYTNPIVTSNGAKVDVPSSFVNSNKLVFVDLKLQTPTDTLTYQSRTIPLSIYKNGEYLPLVIISTPSHNIVAGIRTCEPCGSFSFTIVQGSNLKCDVCGTEWNVETFAGVSGGCQSYPPPKLTATNGDNVEIDLSLLQLPIASN